MKKYLPLTLLFVLLNCHLQSMADEVKDSTDGSFVGENSEQPINSSFVGDDSNSVVNDSWGKEDVPKKTDSAFVGTELNNDGNNLFAGSAFDQEVKEQKDPPFAGDRAQTNDSNGQ